MFFDKMWGKRERCPNCGMEVYDPYDIRLCGGCNKRICPRCSAVTRGDVQVFLCFKCAGTKKGILEGVSEAIERVNEINKKLWGIDDSKFIA